MSSLCGLIFKSASVHPEDSIKLCKMCYESGAVLRACCSTLYCDHCYTKNKLCPNCESATRIEKQTGAAFVLNVYSEHEECRACLDPGLKRMCCGNYYCDECYFAIPQCRSCGVDVGKKSINIQLGKASLIMVLFGFLVSFFCVAASVGLIMVAITNEKLTPLGVSGYNCYGMFRTCDVPVCIDMPLDVAYGASPLPPLSDWKYCTYNSKSKIQTLACVFDPQLYTLTDKAMGFDICTENFEDGIFVFEDTFEAWLNSSFHSNQMVSAKWHQIINGRTSSFCGASPTIYGESKTALTFSGPDNRFAETIDFDMSSGGYLQFDIFIPPIGYDLTHPLCKSAYGSVIFADYSTDGGYNWTNIKTYNAWDYNRLGKFVTVHVDVPASGSSSKTRFRFGQREFDVNRDNWALDNVKILRYLPKDYIKQSGFVFNLHSAYKKIQRAQCCFDTDWCEQRLSQTQMDNCKKDFPVWYHGRTYLLRGAEAFIVIAVCIIFVKAIYLMVEDFYVRNKIPFQEEIQDIGKIDRIYNMLPPRYRPKKQLSQFANDVHMSARLTADLRDQFSDGVNEEALKKKAAKIEARKERERKLKEKQKQEALKRVANIKVAMHGGKIPETLVKVEKKHKMRKKKASDDEIPQSEEAVKAEAIFALTNKSTRLKEEKKEERKNRKKNANGDEQDMVREGPLFLKNSMFSFLQTPLRNSSGDPSRASTSPTSLQIQEVKTDDGRDDGCIDPERNRNRLESGVNETRSPASPSTHVDIETGPSTPTKGQKQTGGALFDEIERGDIDNPQDEEKDDMQDTEFGVDKIATEDDKFKRKNTALLRQPFDTKVDKTWRFSFTVISLGLFAIMWLWMSSTTVYYIIHQPIEPYGVFKGDIAFTSAGIGFMCFCMDFKEMYHVLKHTVVARDEWTPMITVDLSDGINSLYIGDFTVPLENITEAHLFSKYFAYFLGFCYFLSAYPWCMFSIVLRNNYLEYRTMRFVTPFVGAMIISRALLGTGHLVKIYFTIERILDPSLAGREKLGAACQTERNRMIAQLVSGTLSITALFFSGIVAAKYAWYIFAGSIVFGYFYGLVTGCVRSMPIRPWMYLTVLEEGVWLSIRKKQKCPCVYYGAFCNDIHDSTEAFVIFPTDKLRFLTTIKSGVKSSGGEKGVVSM